MAGPTSSVILNFTPNETDLADIRNIIEKISVTVEGEDFWVATTAPIGGLVKFDNSIEARPFIWEVEKLTAGDFHSASELGQIADFSHTKPLFSLALIAMCNGQVDHRILGELTLYFATKLKGVIDFGDNLEPEEIAGYKGKIRDINREEFEAAYSIFDPEFMKLFRKPGFG